MPTPIKLKPCPFCGGKATMREYSNGHKGNGEFTASYKVGCEKCQIYFFFPGEPICLGKRLSQVYRKRLRDGDGTLEYPSCPRRKGGYIR